MGANHNTSRCNFCEKEISSITSHLQDRPASVRWKKFGKCCASCDSDTLIDFGDNIKTFSVDASSLNNKSAIQNNEIINKPADSDNNFDLKDDLKHRRIKAGKRLITIGRISGFIGVIAFFVLFYNEYALLAAGGLVILLAGILLCRIGVFKIARCSRSPLRKPMHSEPRHH